MPEMTVNVLRPYADAEEELSGDSIYFGTTRFTVEWGTNTWGWMGFISPTGIRLTAYLGEEENTHWVDGEIARADGLSRKDRIDLDLSLGGYYKLRGQHPWVHFPPRGRSICTWPIKDYQDADAGVRAARQVEEYLKDGTDQGTIQVMVGLASPFAITFR